MCCKNSCFSTVCICIHFPLLTLIIPHENYYISLSFQALISHDNYAIRETIVQENGKVVAETDEFQHFHLPLDYFEVKNNRPLRLQKKLYEFYTAPITKFWAHSVSNNFCFNILTSHIAIALTITIKSIQNKGKESENSYQKLKKSQWDGHT